jgi:hypothetical protein
LRPTQANSSQDPNSKRTRAKQIGGMAQVVKCQLCKHKPQSHQKKKISLELKYRNSNYPREREVDTCEKGAGMERDTLLHIL